MTNQLLQAAEALCSGRLVFVHEGGYSKDYVPFCGLAVMEELCGVKTPVVDSYLSEVTKWGYQSLQMHQKAVVDAVCANAGLPREPDAEGCAGIKVLLLHMIRCVPATVCFAVMLYVRCRTCMWYILNMNILLIVCNMPCGWCL